MTYAFFAPVQNDVQAVNQLIRTNLSSQVPLVEEIATYLINAGGKRLRPLLVLLSALASGYTGSLHIKLAAVIEFLHTAMLLHDDVVDASELRRGRKTVNAAWGNPASVLVGDFLHSRAFEMMVEIGELKVMQILSRATNVIAEGEVQQLSHLGNANTSEAAYLEIITRKTAKLFEASAHSGSVLAKASSKAESALKKFGLHLGMAFQLIDDQLDYAGDTAALGKNVGDDLGEGKVTLPLIIAMREGSLEEQRFIRHTLAETVACSPDGAQAKQVADAAAEARAGQDDNNLTVAQNEVRGLVQSSGGLDYTRQAAGKQQRLALGCLDCLADSTYRDALAELAEFAISRQH